LESPRKQKRVGDGEKKKWTEKETRAGKRGKKETCKEENKMQGKHRAPIALSERKHTRAPLIKQASDGEKTGKRMPKAKGESGSGRGVGGGGEEWEEERRRREKERARGDRLG
jgi:hypothetical protein